MRRNSLDWSRRDKQWKRFEPELHSKGNARNIHDKFGNGKARLRYEAICDGIALNGRAKTSNGNESERNGMELRRIETQRLSKDMQGDGIDWIAFNCQNRRIKVNSLDFSAFIT